MRPRGALAEQPCQHPWKSGVMPRGSSVPAVPRHRDGLRDGDLHRAPSFAEESAHDLSSATLRRRCRASCGGRMQLARVTGQAGAGAVADSDPGRSVWEVGERRTPSGGVRSACSSAASRHGVSDGGEDQGPRKRCTHHSPGCWVVCALCCSTHSLLCSARWKVAARWDRVRDTEEGSVAKAPGVGTASVVVA